jgi:hypothetical protein
MVDAYLHLLIEVLFFQKSFSSQNVELNYSSTLIGLKAFCKFLKLL